MHFVLSFINEPLCTQLTNSLLQLHFFKDTQNICTLICLCAYTYICIYFLLTYMYTQTYLLIYLDFIMGWNNFSSMLLNIWTTKAPQTVFLIQKKKLSENLTINSEIYISLALSCSIHCNTGIFSCVTYLSTCQHQDSAPRQNLQKKHSIFSIHASM